MAKTWQVLHHLSFSWRKRARSVLPGSAETTQQALMLSYEGRKAWSGDQSRNQSCRWCLRDGVLLITCCTHRVHPYLPYCFSQIDFQGRPNNSLSYKKCSGGEKKISVWSGKSVGGRKFIFLFFERILTVTSMGHCAVCSTLGCLCIWDCWGYCLNNHNCRAEKQPGDIISVFL